MKEQNYRSIILNCALKQFSESGYDAVSVNDIVVQAGIKKPTLYYYFGSKEGLFEELLKDNYERLDEQLKEVCHYQPMTREYKKDVFPVLLNVVKTYFQFGRENTDFYMMALSLTFAPPSSKPALIAEKYHKNQYYFIEELFYAISRTHANIRGKEKSCSWRLLAVINAQIGLWRRNYTSIEDNDAESIVTQFMHGIFS